MTLLSDLSKLDARIASLPEHDRYRVMWINERVRLSRILQTLRDEADALAESEDIEEESDCECLGLGGFGTLLIFESTPYWTRFCGCPVGRSLQVAHDARAVLIEKIEADARKREEKQERALNIAKRLAQSGIPSNYLQWDLNTFAEVAGREKDAALAAVIETSRRVMFEGRSILLVGAVGTGKTGLACAALKARIQNGGGGYFTTALDMLSALRVSYGGEDAGETAAILERVGTAGLLVLDDLGAENVTAWVREQLLALIDRRTRESRPTIITSNYLPADIGKRLAGDDPVAGQRIASRLIGNFDLVEVAGGDLRMQAPVALART